MTTGYPRRWVFCPTGCIMKLWVHLLIILWVSISLVICWNNNAGLVATAFVPGTGHFAVARRQHIDYLTNRNLNRANPLASNTNDNFEKIDAASSNKTDTMSATISISSDFEAENINGSSNNKEQRRKNPAKNLYEYAKAAAGTFGDIMSSVNDNPGTGASPSTFNKAAETETTSLEKRDGLVTTAIPSGTLASRFGITHPLDRMALTANGNLQRLVSSYYDAPVLVLVVSCILKDNQEEINGSSTQAKTWDRVVQLTVHNQVCVVLY